MERQAAWWLLLLLFYCFTNNVTGENPTVTLKQGKLKGWIHKSTNNKDIYSFTGIPYGKPPLGPLRFKVSNK